MASYKRVPELLLDTGVWMTHLRAAPVVTLLPADAENHVGNKIPGWEEL